ncbi:hypothetical protein HanXRQr2_Chr04g0154471 [Helianthus annuus]|uniref:Uncharacterized protein n=1 Tax=Helianthus annuus TaxID=4232 RepID=A0A9K3NRV9_HELAN|nr:hypothetical protein HanXRQr2_Chr04g0154471 [Helianthus annuus]KAJ0587721.1 hypothetical protein HanIR_Chr04g0166411 [Helianthus annuus]
MLTPASSDLRRNYGVVTFTAGVLFAVETRRNYRRHDSSVLSPSVTTLAHLLSHDTVQAAKDEVRMCVSGRDNDRRCSGSSSEVKERGGR